MPTPLYLLRMRCTECRRQNVTRGRVATFVNSTPLCLEHASEVILRLSKEAVA